jgi:iron complex transport system ATP-binding protein
LFGHHKITAEMQESALQALALMEAGHLADTLLAEMSTGEVRRILFARALVTEPRALMLDEPTTGLDLLARQRFLDTLRTIGRRGKIIILTTHHLEEIFPEIGRVVLIRQGRVMLDGHKQDVLTSANLSALFGAPMQVQESQRYYLARSGA